LNGNKPAAELTDKARAEAAFICLFGEINDILLPLKQNTGGKRRKSSARGARNPEKQ
jgi:hypothetical protein